MCSAIHTWIGRPERAQTAGSRDGAGLHFLAELRFVLIPVCIPAPAHIEVGIRSVELQVLHS